MRWTTWSMVAALVLVIARGASAQPAPEPPKLIRFAAELHVDLGAGTERCPDPAYLRREVVAELGYDPFAPGAKWRRAGAFDVKVVRIPSGLEATTTFVDDASVTQWTRQYRDHTTTRAACESVYKGVALQIDTALTRFADAAAPQRAPTCTTSEPCPSCPAPAPCLDSRFSIWPTEWPLSPLRPLPPDPPKPLDRWPVAVRIGVAAWPELIASGLGSLGFSVEAGARYRAFSAGVEAHGDPPMGSVTFPGSGAVSFGRMSGALLVCGHYGWFAGCGVGDVGRLIFPNHIRSLPAGAFYGAAGVRARMEFPVAPPRIFIVTTLDVRAPIDPPNFSTMHGNIFEAAGLSVGFGLGVLVELAP